MTHPERAFSQVEKLDTTDAVVVYQGTEGAYSQQAMMEFFGKDCRSFHVGTWKEAMDAIEQGKADYAVLPIENSTAGIVSENYDLLVEYDNYIVGEQLIKVRHCLLGLPEAEFSDISVVYSHPQALMQCSDYLDRQDWETISYRNTASAAEKVKKDGLKNQAAIASRITADLYDLKILDEGIQNNKKNATRFIIVAHKKIYTQNAGKISICMELPNESGALYRILSHFYFMNLNMINIQSRPIPEKSFTYRFFVDFEGNFRDDNVQKALRRLQEDTADLKILGSY